MPETKIVDTKEDRPVSCYGCGSPGIIRSRCRTCNPVRQKDDALSSSLNQSHFYSFPPVKITLLVLFKYPFVIQKQHFVLILVLFIQWLEKNYTIFLSKRD
ncbi:hypothetical protein TNCT_202681 [Trichonephila clavata]|uniref:Uncharacterized protein n=1 Tax=Trichonephila clavata TaxID=2740835 RepID=A0A8X6KFD1_TRICU|nr:hypothetical protein TNCT_202681 [Trichonephila clavata]